MLIVLDTIEIRKQTSGWLVEIILKQAATRVGAG
jgi:hypothetical protein